MKNDMATSIYKHKKYILEKIDFMHIMYFLEKVTSSTESPARTPLPSIIAS